MAVPTSPALPDHVLLTRAGHAVGRFHHRAAAEHGLTPTSLGVLHELCREGGGTSHRELASRLGITPATLTPVVDTLAGSGDLTRERDPSDRRVVRLSITAHGRERRAATAPVVEAAVAARIPPLSPQHARIVRNYLLAVLEIG